MTHKSYRHKLYVCRLCFLKNQSFLLKLARLGGEVESSSMDPPQVRLWVRCSSLVWWGGGLRGAAYLWFHPLSANLQAICRRSYSDRWVQTLPVGYWWACLLDLTTEVLNHGPSPVVSCSCRIGKLSRRMNPNDCALHTAQNEVAPSICSRRLTVKVPKVGQLSRTGRNFRFPMHLCVLRTNRIGADKSFHNRPITCEKVHTAHNYT